MFMKWLVAMIRECGAPICFLSGLYVVLGISFLVLSAPVAGVLLITGFAIAALFILLSYLTYRREKRLVTLADRRKRNRLAVAD